MGIGSFLFGSAGHHPDVSNQEAQLYKATQYGLGNAAGATQTGTDENGYPTYDWSQTSKPTTVAGANSQYDYSGINNAQNALSNPQQFNQTYTAQTYNPYQFNYGDSNNINQQASNQYQLASSDINNQGASNLAKIQENVGTRRPGLLLNAAQNNARDMSKNLAQTRTGLNTAALGQNLALGAQQQRDQSNQNLAGAQFNAGQQQNAYQSRADLEKNNAANNLSYGQAAGNLGLNKLAQQENITNTATQQQNNILQSLINQYNHQLDSRRGTTFAGSPGLINQIGQVASTVGKVGSLFA